MKWLILLIGLSLNAQIEGKVIDKQSYWSGGNIYTTNFIETETDTIEVKTLGGIVGLQAETVSDTPQLYIGQRGTFFLNDNALERFETTNSNSVLNASVSPTTVNGGVGEVITITGVGFGERNKLSFPYADAGGALLNVDDYEIISWSDTEIVCNVPSYAGTGSLLVRTLENGNIETNVLTIPYSIINFKYQEQSYRPEPIDDNLLGGYTFQFSTSMTDVGRDKFTNAINTWRCQTNNNWTFGEDIESQTIANDGINIVTMSVSGSLPTNVLGRCTTRYQGCAVNGVIEWYVTEYDIVFNSDIVLDYTNNNGNGYHFETIALHELGHAHGQAHVVAPEKLMHYAVSVNDLKINLGQSDLDGGNFYVDTADGQCGLNGVIGYECGTLSTPDFEVEKVVLYTELYDLHGRKVTNNLSNGLYLKKIVYIDGSFNVVKVIK